MMDAQKALVWRGNNFIVVTTPLLTPSRVPGYILPARFHTPHTPHEVPLSFRHPHGSSVRHLALSCIVLRHQLPIHWLMSLCVLPVWLT